MNEAFMRKALLLARKGGPGRVLPNPLVGAVIVRDGQIIGSGFHAEFGAKHAEVMAVEDALGMLKNAICSALTRETSRRTNQSTSASFSRSSPPVLIVFEDPLKTRVEFARDCFKGCDLYVTLEPCSHFGKTPPCCDLILKAGFESVFIGMNDPFFDSARGGKGVSGSEILKNSGVEIEFLPLESSLRKKLLLLNQAYLKCLVSDLPYVCLKAAVSLDGKVVTRGGESQWITCEGSRADAKRLRSEFDAVIVGAGTVLADDPILARVAGSGPGVRALLRVLIDKELSVPTSAKIFRDEQVFVATSSLASAERRRQFASEGIEFQEFGSDRIVIADLLRHLRTIGICSVFVEGGSEVHGSFVDEAIVDGQIIDQVVFYCAPKIFGGRLAKSVIGGDGCVNISDALSVRDLSLKRIQDDFRIDGLVNLYC